jgi:transcriptional regulator with XRE-family HTH domain
MVIDSHKLSAGAFADRIGVQRSNVSHVLSGRNKPSFEFIEKVLVAFPKVQAHWLMTGKHLSAAEERDQQSVVKPGVEQSRTAYPRARDLLEKHSAKKQIVKIVTFYSDFTFDTYFPNGQ